MVVLLSRAWAHAREAGFIFQQGLLIEFAGRVNIVERFGELVVDDVRWQAGSGLGDEAQGAGEPGALAQRLWHDSDHKRVSCTAAGGLRRRRTDLAGSAVAVAGCLAAAPFSLY